MSHTYLIALGGNKRHRFYGEPRAVLRAASFIMNALGAVHQISNVVTSRPLGPSIRNYANGALILETKLAPYALLQALKRIEAQFGQRRGQRWSARVLDLDIILWSGGAFNNADLHIPHPLFRDRGFVLKPASEIAADWRDPISGLSLKQLARRLSKPRTKTNQ